MGNLIRYNERRLIMDQLMKILKDVREDIDFEKETELIDGEVLDSFDIISIIMEINNVFNIEIDPEDLEADNFNSAEAIWKLIQVYQSK